MNKEVEICRTAISVSALRCFAKIKLKMSCALTHVFILKMNGMFSILACESGVPTCRE